MSNPILFKNFTAGAAIAAFRLVKFSAAETVIQAAAVGDFIIGATQDVAPANGERAEILMQGIAWVEAGAAFALGALLTSDSVGRAIVAAPAAGTNNRIAGFALDAAVAAGDQVRVLLSPCSFQG
jgi:hypothetical protein